MRDLREAAHPESDLGLLVLFPTDGIDAAEKLDLLRVISTEEHTTQAGRVRDPGGVPLAPWC